MLMKMKTRESVDLRLTVTGPAKGGPGYGSRVPAHFLISHLTLA